MLGVKELVYVKCIMNPGPGTKVILLTIIRNGSPLCWAEVFSNPPDLSFPIPYQAFIKYSID